MNTEIPVVWYAKWLNAWNEPNPELVYDLVTEDFTLSTPTLRNSAENSVGPNSAVKYLEYVLSMYPDLKWEQSGPPMFSLDAPRASFTWVGTGHFSGRMDPPGIEGNGLPFKFTGVEVFDFRDDRVSALDVSYDLLGLLKQIQVIGGRQRD